MSLRHNSIKAGHLLAAASGLFWLSWALMPGVGVTDAREIFRLVGSQRTLVMMSVVVQLVSAVLYVPALIALVTDKDLGSVTRVRLWSGVLLAGAMGSAADAVLHLMAYAMTAPGAQAELLIPVMSFMQGPGLMILAPLILSFFVGGAGLSFALRRAGLVSAWNPWLHAIALVIAIFGSIFASNDLLDSRAVGLAFLGVISFAQVSAGIGSARNKTRGIRSNPGIKGAGKEL